MKNVRDGKGNVATTTPPAAPAPSVEPVPVSAEPVPETVPAPMTPSITGAEAVPSPVSPAPTTPEATVVAPPTPEEVVAPVDLDATAR